MRISLLAVGLALPTMLAAMPAQAEVVEIAPSSAWNLDYGETKCRLARLFGEGDAKHVLFLEQYWPGQGVGMTVAGPSFKRFRSRARTDLAFAEGHEPHRTEPFAGMVEDYGEAVIYSQINIGAALRGDAEKAAADATEDLTLPLLDKDGARRAQFVGLKQRGDEYRLMTGPLDKAFEALDACTLDLVGTWGLDPEAQRTATRMPQWTNRDGVVRRIVATYPREAARTGEQGIMRMRVIVSPEGKVEDCVILKATETERLDSPACRAMANAQFEPALDAAGQPMRSFFAESIVYQMGG
ncbi:energy transducer TonB [Porphyrobacter sp. YT40]|uniref:energy transducer TonB n=1 Tax=Porphyrobacter sp. YT40 TaxID=2547601 RepID=UPI0011411D35|nr:energy transducer TonB [Porphyrobacter sp. YT40]QDH33500.1 energy transducer TonB [Porphyrobacter sp. YT40]